MKKEKDKVAALQEINRKLRAEIAAHRQADEVALRYQYYGKMKLSR